MDVDGMDVDGMDVNSMDVDGMDWLFDNEKAVTLSRRAISCSLIC